MSKATRFLAFAALLLSVLAASPASAQCNGVFGAGQVCGSVTGGPPSPINLPSISLDAICSTNNDFLIRITGTWQCGSFGNGLTLTSTTLSVNAGTGLGFAAGALNLQPSAASTIGGVQSKTCAGSNWISTISTAGVETCTQPAFTDISGTATAAQIPATGGLGFYFDKNNTNQTGMTTGAYVLVTFSTTKFNTTGAALTSSTWTAPISGLIIMEGTIFWNAHAASSGNPNFTLKFIKNSAGVCNGSDVFAEIGTPIVGFATAAINTAVGVDQATAGDVYELCAFGTSDDSGNDLGIDGNQAHTHWSGAYLR